MLCHAYSAPASENTARLIAPSPLVGEGTLMSAASTRTRLRASSTFDAVRIGQAPPFPRRRFAPELSIGEGRSRFAASLPAKQKRSPRAGARASRRRRAGGGDRPVPARALHDFRFRSRTEAKDAERRNTLSLILRNVFCCGAAPAQAFRGRGTGRRQHVFRRSTAALANGTVHPAGSASGQASRKRCRKRRVAPLAPDPVAATHLACRS
jgi:hypothetical protein